MCPDQQVSGSDPQTPCSENDQWSSKASSKNAPSDRAEVGQVRKRIFDAFCGAGGGAEGYRRAGFYVVGCDIEPQPHYAGDEFIQADVLDLLADEDFMAQFDAVHASPPCQAKTTMSNRWRGQGGKADSHINLIFPVRKLLLATGLPFVLENVPGARHDLIAPVTFTGGQFGLRVHRPRLFESNIELPKLPKAAAPRDSIGVYGKAPDGRLLWRRKDGTEQHAAKGVAEAQEAMGMPWCPDWRGIAEAIPPAYTEHVGLAIAAHLNAQDSAESGAA